MAILLNLVKLKNLSG